MERGSSIEPGWSLTGLYIEYLIHLLHATCPGCCIYEMMAFKPAFKAFVSLSFVRINISSIYSQKISTVWLAQKFTTTQVS